MRRWISRGAESGVVVALVLTVVVVMVAAPAGAYAPAERPSTTTDADRPVGVGDTNETASESTPISGSVRELLAAARAGDADSQFVTRSDAGLRVAVTIEAAPGDEDDVVKRLKRHGSVTARFGGAIDATLPPEAVETIAAATAVTAVRRPTPVVGSDQGSTVSEGLSSINVSDELHASGINGSNVTVAVVDTGFDVDNDEIDHHVAGFRDFEGDGMDNASGLHGTAVAELVVDVAPNVSLLLYEVETATGMGAAIEHVTQNTSADVASMSLGLLTGPFDGSSRIDGAIDDSVANGTTWFVSSGNYADEQHYNGTWRDDDGDDWMDVPESGETIEVEAQSGSEVYVSWSGDDASSQDYDVYLNDSETGAIVNVSNTRQNGSQRPVEKVQANTSDTFTLAIEKVNASGEADFDLFGTGGAVLRPSTAARSVVRPATAESAIAVGAVRYTDTDLEEFSSRGPTVDGRTKPELVGPDGVETSTYDGGFSGTSAATPHAAGVAALVLDSVDESIGPPELRQSLTESATPLADEVPNNRTGYGLVNATGAVAAAGGTEDATFSVLEFRAPSTATVGETVGVNATIANTGDTPRTGNLTYVFDGTVERNRTISLDGGNSTEERFEIPTDDISPGTYEHGVSIGEKSRTEEIDLRQPATFNLSELDAPSAAVVGETIAVNATVENEGGVEGEVAVEYLFDGSVVGTRNVSIPGGTQKKIGFSIGTDNITPGTYEHGVSVDGSSRTVEITVQRPATFELSKPRISGNAVAGERFIVNTTVTNVGDVAGTAAVTYLFNGTVSGNRSVMLAGDTSINVSFDVATDGIDPGSYEHEVRTDGSSTDADITILQPATFELTDLDAPGMVAPDGTFPVNATVRNVGDVAGTTEIEYVFDGAVVQNRSVRLGGSNSTVVRFEVASDEGPGTYDHGVRSAGSNRTAQIVVNAPPVAAFTVNATEPGVAETVTFDASDSTDDDGTIAAYEWDLDGDGMYDDATGIKAESVFGSAGETTVGLRVIDDDGGRNTTAMTLTVRATSTPDPTGTVETTDATGTVETTDATGTETPPDQTGEMTAGGSTDDSGTDEGSTDTPGLPGFGPVVALLGLLVFVTFVRRVRRDDR